MTYRTFNPQPTSRLFSTRDRACDSDRISSLRRAEQKLVLLLEASIPSAGVLAPIVRKYSGAACSWVFLLRVRLTEQTSTLRRAERNVESAAELSDYV